MSVKPPPTQGSRCNRLPEVCCTDVFGSHPHGIISVGAIANFASDATGFSQLFPGLKPHLLTLTSNFKLPLYREILMSMGICSVSRKSCQTILRQGGHSLFVTCQCRRLALTLHTLVGAGSCITSELARMLLIGCHCSFRRIHSCRWWRS